MCDSQKHTERISADRIPKHLQIISHNVQNSDKDISKRIKTFYLKISAQEIIIYLYTPLHRYRHSMCTKHRYRQKDRQMKVLTIGLTYLHEMVHCRVPVY
jgi:hypothetical protein